MSFIGGSSWLCQLKLLLAFACYCCLLAQANSFWARSEKFDDIDGLNWKICGLRRPGPYGTRSTRQDIGPRMSAGWDADRGEYPWTVLIKIEYQALDTYFICTGSIIHHNLIFTAAHCLDARDGAKPSKIIVWPGIISSYENITAQSAEAASHCQSRLYKGNVNYPHSDLGLIKLKSSILYTRDVRPICINHPEDPEPPLFTDCIVSGFGVTNSSNKYELLEDRKLRGLGMDPCPDDVRPEPPKDENEVCMVTYNEEKYPGNACGGDSGGGLSCFDSERDDGRYYLSAVVSNGPNLCQFGKAIWGLYANVWKQRGEVLEMYERCGR